MPPADSRSAHSTETGPNAGHSNEHRGWHARGYQPHCDFPGLIQSIGFRLFDSVPSKVVDRWRRELDERQPRGTLSSHSTSVASNHLRSELPLNDDARRILRDRIDRYADMGYGSCFLKDERIASLVENALLHFDHDRYDLLAWCIMSNHVHVLMVPAVGHRLSEILQTWKSYTAHQANKILERDGEFWFPNYFDGFLRTTKQMEATIDYIEFNPVAAKLVARPGDWLYSSAAPRHRERVVKNRCRYPEIDPSSLPDF